MVVITLAMTPKIVALLVTAGWSLIGVMGLVFAFMVWSSYRSQVYD